MSDERPFLLDVSRLIWRTWSGRLHTGIDRVCAAYLDEFADRSLAVVQRGRFRVVLDAKFSDQLFALLRDPRHFRTMVSLLLARSIIVGQSRNIRDKLYLNIGHTGLDSADLEGWIYDKQLRPFFLVHDIIPITHPEYCRAGEFERHVKRIRLVLRCAKGVIANSQATLDALSGFATTENMPMPPAIVALLGTPKHDIESADLPIKSPYFLTIGTIEARKNHLLLLHVWERLIRKMGDQTPLLAIVGQRGWEADDVFAMLDRAGILKRHVIELGRCDDQMMRSLLHNARALLMPSHVEGFGIPVIEALEQGTPVIASNLPVYREIAADIPTYIDPMDGQGWETAVLDFTGESPERQRQLDAMTDYEPPSWEAHFEKVELFLSVPCAIALKEHAVAN